MCDEPDSSSCSTRFCNDEHHQYVLSNCHRLWPKQRLDLIALMRNDLHETDSSFVGSHERYEKMRTSSSNSSIVTHANARTHSNSDDVDCPVKLTYPFDGLRRKKSASLNSPANAGKEDNGRCRAGGSFCTKTVSCRSVNRRAADSRRTRTTRIAVVLAQLFGKSTDDEMCAGKYEGMSPLFDMQIKLMRLTRCVLTDAHRPSLIMVA
jgi:hypothetical protein